MYYLYAVLSLWFFVLWAPAVAVFPALMKTPQSAVTIPAVSAGMVYIYTTLLIQCSIFTPLSVSLVCGMMAFIALYRLRGQSIVALSPSDKRWLAFIFMLILPFMAKLGTSGFDSSDEMYSWNVWALQHASGWWNVDFVNVTNAAYPQLFPKVIAFMYHWLGDTELQLPLKAALIAFSASSLGVIAFTRPAPNTQSTRVLLILLLCFGTHVSKYFSYAYADPVMSACLIASISGWLHYQETGKNSYLIQCVFLSIAAAFTKQPAMIWCVFSLPLLLLARQQRKDTFAALVCIAGGLLWILGEGAGFHSNGGVVSASFAQRSWFSQILYAVQTHLLANPLVGLSFITVCSIAFKNRSLRGLWCLWGLPSTVLWLMFGAYDLRLGMHIVLGMALIICHHGLIEVPRLVFKPKPWLVTAMVLSVFSSSLMIKKSLLWRKGYSPYESGKITVAKYFGDDSEWIYDTFYKNYEVTGWAPTDYIVGLFYMKSNIVRPHWIRFDRYNPLEVNDFTKQLLLDELWLLKPDYAFTAGQVAGRGSIASRTLEVLAAQYPEAFKTVADKPNRYGYKTFQIDYPALAAAHILDAPA